MDRYLRQKVNQRKRGVLIFGIWSHKWYKLISTIVRWELSNVGKTMIGITVAFELTGFKNGSWKKKKLRTILTITTHCTMHSVESPLAHTYLHTYRQSITQRFFIYINLNILKFSVGICQRWRVVTFKCC